MTCLCPALTHVVVLSGNLTAPQLTTTYTEEPTPLPTGQPTRPPSHEPTSKPSPRPTPHPTTQPSLTYSPTGSTSTPTSIRPSQAPSMTPTLDRAHAIRVSVHLGLTATRDFVERCARAWPERAGKTGWR